MCILYIRIIFKEVNTSASLIYVYVRLKIIPISYETGTVSGYEIMIRHIAFDKASLGSWEPN